MKLSILIVSMNYQFKYQTSILKQNLKKNTHTQIEAQCKNKSKTEFNKLTTNLQKLKLGTVLLARKIIQVLNFANAYMF